MQSQDDLERAHVISIALTACLSRGAGPPPPPDAHFLAGHQLCRGLPRPSLARSTCCRKRLGGPPSAIGLAQTLGASSRRTWRLDAGARWPVHAGVVAHRLVHQSVAGAGRVKLLYSTVAVESQLKSRSGDGRERHGVVGGRPHAPTPRCHRPGPGFGGGRRLRGRRGQQLVQRVGEVSGCERH
ncbi:hypothetical protein BU14_0493s0018 [Porphyra umbilicalis]|uniref:Uncharacterized protein n=1 Tax=Porphyra umbilicalis TaxID=2786 RepID=A0A1X6NTD6_PORUM|nr:hypothetical protein BU14_0493s0018 [Porphyra umbilicalis]|eukprot:OSX71874.1 hypothetical protein BU14_0493s0018 [Porphyra umbilicalis]